MEELKQINRTGIVLGFSVVGLEASFLFMYRAGWTVSTAQIAQSALPAVVPIFVGYFLYKEAITLRRLAGILICMVELYLINR